VKENDQVATRTRASRRSAGTSGGTRGDTGGGSLNRDYGDDDYREPGEGYNGPTPKKGLYPAKLVSINEHTKQGDDEPSSIRWGFELIGGTSPDDDGEEKSVEGFRDYQYTNDDTTLWREHQIAVALGLIKPNGKLKMTFKQILDKAKPCTVRIIRERYVPEDGGDPEWRAKIAAVLAARAETAGKATSRRRAKDEDATDVFDGDEDGDDEEEETPPPRRSRSRKKAEPEPEPEPEDEDEEDEEEGDEDDWPEDPDELAAALEELSLAELKTTAKEDFGVTVKRGMKADAIVDAILDTLDAEEEDEEDEEPEEEPEPPKRRSRAGTAKTAAKGRTKRGSQDPPF
jgi:hypothetical protein